MAKVVGADAGYVFLDDGTVYDMDWTQGDTLGAVKPNWVEIAPIPNTDRDVELSYLKERADDEQRD